MKKTIIIILVTILAEILIAIIWGIFVYYNYDWLTASDSWVSDKIIQKELKKLDLVIDNSQNSNTWSSYYNWVFWKVELVEKNIDDNKIYSKEKSIIYEVLLEEINKQIIFKTLINNNLLDKYLYTWLLDSDELETDVNNILTFHTLLWTLEKNDWDKIIDEIIAKQTQIRGKFIPLIKLNNYEELSLYFSSLEEELSYDLSLLSDNLFVSNVIITNENFQYIVSKLFSDSYYENIKKVSLVTWIDEKLIISAIWVEQLRFLTTDRWYAKNLIKQNKLLTNFNKFSYWLWGIKFDTFKKINAGLQEYDMDFYNKYFKEYDLKAMVEAGDSYAYSDYNIQMVLEDEYSWVLYSAALIYNIEKKRELAWYPINNKPWIIITLYNMWNEKTPHWNPDTWGSRISVDENNTYYFWELGLIMYLYIKYYL